MSRSRASIKINFVFGLLGTSEHNYIIRPERRKLLIKFPWNIRALLPSRSFYARESFELCAINCFPCAHTSLARIAGKSFQRCSFRLKSKLFADPFFNSIPKARMNAECTNMDECILSAVSGSMCVCIWVMSLSVQHFYLRSGGAGCRWLPVLNVLLWFVDSARRGTVFSPKLTLHREGERKTQTLNLCYEHKRRSTIINTDKRFVCARVCAHLFCAFCTVFSWHKWDDL